MITFIVTLVKEFLTLRYAGSYKLTFQKQSLKKQTTQKVSSQFIPLHLLTWTFQTWLWQHGCEQTAWIHFYAVNQNVCVCDLKILSKKPVNRGKQCESQERPCYHHIICLCGQTESKDMIIPDFQTSHTLMQDVSWGFWVGFPSKIHRLVSYHACKKTNGMQQPEICELLHGCANTASANEWSLWLWPVMRYVEIIFLCVASMWLQLFCLGTFIAVYINWHHIALVLMGSRICSV